MCKEQKSKLNDDLISRQDAIRWVKTECNPYGKPTLDYDSGLKVIEHLKKMPSAPPPAEPERPKRTETMMVGGEPTEIDPLSYEVGYSHGQSERPRGEWILKEHLWECDQCGCRINRAEPLKGNIWNYNFCPNCGARMFREDGKE